jgi:hypothetical protein
MVYRTSLISTGIIHVIQIFIPKSDFLVHSATMIAEPEEKLYLSIWVFHDYELTSSNASNQVQHLPSAEYAKKKIHRIASTHDYLLDLHPHNYKWTPDFSFSFQFAFLQID